MTLSPIKIFENDTVADMCTAGVTGIIHRDLINARWMDVLFSWNRLTKNPSDKLHIPIEFCILVYGQVCFHIKFNTLSKMPK